MTSATSSPARRRFDVIVATYNRPALLARLLASLQRAQVPEAVDARFIIVDNNSRPDHAARNAELVRALGDARFRRVVESRQGLSYARNAGIAASDAEWLGFVDDDEQVDSSWLVVAHAHLESEHVGFIGGPYLPDWQSTPPAWLPASIGRYVSTVGWVDLGSTTKEFGRELDAIAMGGNFVVKRCWLEAVGRYDTDLGRVSERLLSSEDHDMHDRLIAAGARGFYVPELIIYHHIPSTRLTKRYHRQWAFWHGFSMQALERRGAPHGMPMLFGMPRYLTAEVLQRLPQLARSLLPGGNVSPEAFARELDLIEYVGRLYEQASKRFGRTVPRAPKDRSTS